MQIGPSDLSVVPLESMEARMKLKRYLDNFKGKRKSSLCRFYLRGLCIVKPEICCFAHSWSDLQLEEDKLQDEMAFDCTLNEKERRKKFFSVKEDFHQQALFIIRNITYYNLYEYQFSPHMLANSWVSLPLEEFFGNRPVRQRLRQCLHRGNWDMFLQYLEQRFPRGHFTISMLSLWFCKVGFEKPQTRCKFGDFLRYIVIVKGYVQLYILIPPRISKRAFFIKPRVADQDDILVANLEAITVANRKEREQEKEAQRLKFAPLPGQLRKKFMCRYIMSGNCELPSEDCMYAHSIDELRFELRQVFDPKHRQPTKAPEDRKTMTSLYEFYMDQMDGTVEFEDFNMSPQLKNEARRKLHMRLYHQFIQKLQDHQGTDKIPLRLLQAAYNSAGFNHTEGNKFGLVQDLLWEMGYGLQDVIKGTKVIYIYRLPPIQRLDMIYRQLFLKVFEEQRKVRQEVLLTQVRRRLYKQTQPFIPQLHLYLKLKNKTFEEVLQQVCPEEMKMILNSEEVKTKITNELKLLFGKNQDVILRITDLEQRLRDSLKQIVAQFVDFKRYITLTLLGLGKRVYTWHFNKNLFVIDIKTKKKSPKHASMLTRVVELQKRLTEIKIFGRKPEFLLVDNSQKALAASQLLQGIAFVGVDLQGQLRKGGNIDLIQLCFLDERKNQKHIVIYDMFQMQDKKMQCLQRCIQDLRRLFSSEAVVKIMHDCRQDTLALKELLFIPTVNAFDTSGMDFYFQQRAIYDRRLLPTETLQLLQTQLKAGGLNNILGMYGNNGVNEYKQVMKERFRTMSRQYFTNRPIEPQFLSYSIRDVQDLLEVYCKMQFTDDQFLSEFIGSLYATGDLLTAPDQQEKGEWSCLNE